MSNGSEELLEIENGERRIVCPFAPAANLIADPRCEGVSGSMSFAEGRGLKAS